MKTSDQINELSEALAAAQGALKNPAKTKTNPHFKSQYVDLSDGLAAVRECLSKHGLMIVQGTSIHDSAIILHTRISHKSGQWIEAEYPVGGFGRPQEMGSALTYARRYSLFAMVGIAGEDDDDGNAAQEAAGAPQKPAKAEPKKMEPGHSPDESRAVYEVLKEGMIFCRDAAELLVWAKDNDGEIRRLTPKDKKELQDAYKARREELLKVG